MFDGDDPADPFGRGVVVEPTAEELAQAEDTVLGFDPADPRHVLVEWPAFDPVDGATYREWTAALWAGIGGGSSAGAAPNRCPPTPAEELQFPGDADRHGG